MVTERAYRPWSGWFTLFVVLLLIVAVPFLLARGAMLADDNEPGAVWFIIAGILGILTAFITLFGFLAIAPNDARVLLLFGEYKGSVRESGCGPRACRAT